MELNTSGKRGRGRSKKWKLSHGSPPVGQMFPAVVVGSPQKPDGSANRQGLSALHTACLHGQLANVRLLVESMQGGINSRDLQGRRPLHMVLSSRSSRNTSSCLSYLLEHGADVNLTTDSGATPLHLAASEGLLDCTKILMQGGADVSAQDSMGHTPLDSARICCRRDVARYLRSCVWHVEKKKEMQERKLLQTLYSDFVDFVKVNNINKKTLVDEKMLEWADKKGFPLRKDFSPSVLVSQYHTRCLPSDQISSDPKHATHPVQHQSGGPLEDKSTSAKQPPASTSRPWSVFMGLQPEKPPREADEVMVQRDGGSKQPQNTTKWDSTCCPAPNVPLDVLERVLFPGAFPSRITSPQHFEPQNIEEVQHRGYPQGQSTSPWTEVAMHLAEVLEPGHY